MLGPHSKSSEIRDTCVVRDVSGRSVQERSESVFVPQSGPELEPRFDWKPLCMTFLTDIFWGLWSHIILSDFDVWLWFLQNAKQSKVVLLNTEKLLDQDIVAARAAWVMLSCSKARASTSFWWPGCASATTACTVSEKNDSVSPC